MAKWRHQASMKWLLARRENQILTATDFKTLFASWKKIMGLNGRNVIITLDKVVDKEPKIKYEDNKEAYVKFEETWGEKISEETPDPMSYNDAARGHIFEPYAVPQVCQDYKLKYYHWDDCLIRNLDLGIGYSPDAMPFKQPESSPEIIETTELKCDKYSILEIKCYGAAHHVKCLSTDSEKLEERLQIAAAMLTDERIEYAILYFYNPDLRKYYGRAIACDRKDLELEIAICKSILDIYNDIKKIKLKDMVKGKLIVTGTDIEQRYLEEMDKPDNVLRYMAV